MLCIVRENSHIFQRGEKNTLHQLGTGNNVSGYTVLLPLIRYLLGIVWENLGSLQSPGSSFHIGEIKDITLVIKNVPFS